MPKSSSARRTAVMEGALNDVRQIGAAAERAARLTHQLLGFGRREVINPEVVDINAIVREVDRLLRRTIGEHVARGMENDCGSLLLAYHNPGRGHG